MTVCAFLAITSLLYVRFSNFFFKFSGRLATSVGGVGVHKGTASYPISRDNAAQVNDVRLYLFHSPGYSRVSFSQPWNNQGYLFQSTVKSKGIFFIVLVALVTNKLC